MDPNTSSPDPDAPPAPIVRCYHVLDDDGTLLAEGVRFADRTHIVKWASAELCVYGPDHPPATAQDITWVGDEQLAAENVELRERYGRHMLKVTSVVAGLVAVNDLLARLERDDGVAVELRYISGKLADALQQREAAN